MFRKALTLAASGALAAGLILAGSSSASSAPVSEAGAVVEYQQAGTPAVAADIKSETPALTTAILAASGGGTACVTAGSYGKLCGGIYQDTSGYVRPYGKFILSPTSPSVSSGSLVVMLCQLDSFNKCINARSESFVTTLGLKKRPRCKEVVRGGIGTSLPCKVNGNAYSVYSKKRYKAYITAKQTTSGGTSTTYVGSSPILTTG